MIILGIETSCDETSAAIVEDGYKLHSLVVNSQIDLHKAFGGVVPEIAARSHIEVVIPVIEQALDEADMTWDEIDAIAVTQGPGLSGSLLIGVMTAKTIAWAKNKPFYPVHHILGHIYANWITDASDGYKLKDSLNFPSKQPEFPVLALVVSGKHSDTFIGFDHNDWTVIGRTRDDAVGEAFDKAAKVLGLPYPGGPSIAQQAEKGDPIKYKLPKPKVDHVETDLIKLREKLSPDSLVSTNISKTGYDYSFSGLKTALLRQVQAEAGVDFRFPSFELAAKLNHKQIDDFSASFQKTAIEYLIDATVRAHQEFQPKTVIIGGGVASSAALRQEISARISKETEYAPPLLCTDNAAMIAAYGYFYAQHNEPTSPHDVEIRPTWPL